ncbi:MAG: VOC family protein [Candidatus Cloacimonetes bacterium]|nr:VOC family protein [Candidatus Cloacimonadota bacterium]
MSDTLGKIDHIGFVVNDLEASIVAYEKALSTVSSPSGITLNPYGFDSLPTGNEKSAVIGTDGQRLELIQPLNHHSIYYNHLQIHGEGLHHIGYRTRNLEQVTSYLVNSLGYTKINDLPEQNILRGCRQLVLKQPKQIHFLVELVEFPEDLLLMISDLARLDDRGLQAVIRQVDRNDLVIVLSAESEPIKQRFFSNMSRRAASMLEDDCKLISEVNPLTYNQCLDNIHAVVRRIIREGNLVLDSSK